MTPTHHATSRHLRSGATSLLRRWPTVRPHFSRSVMFLRPGLRARCPPTEEPRLRRPSTPQIHPLLARPYAGIGYWRDYVLWRWPSMASSCIGLRQGSPDSLSSSASRLTQARLRLLLVSYPPMANLSPMRTPRGYTSGTLTPARRARCPCRAASTLFLQAGSPTEPICCWERENLFTVSGHRAKPEFPAYGRRPSWEAA